MSAPLRALMPPLDQRLREPEIRALADRLPQGDPAAGLEAVLEGVDARIATLEADLAGTEAAVQRGEPGALADWLRAHSAPKKLAADLRALRRRLDLGVVRERTLRAVEREGILEELALRARAQLQPPTHAPFAARLARSRRWQSRLAAVEGLLAQGLPLQQETAQILESRADAPGEHPWVRAACEAALLDRGSSRLAAALLPAADPRHFLTRRRVALVVLHRCPPEEAAALLTPLLSDPSEHVRIGLALDLWRLGALALPLLRALMADPSPRVRLGLVVGARRAGQTLGAEAVFEVVEPALAVGASALLVGEAAAALAELAERAPELAPGVLAALERALSLDWPPPQREAVAVARQRLLCRLDAERRGWFDALQALVARIPAGSSARIPWSELGQRRSDAELGRALAALSADDHGLWATPEPRGLRIWRGDRWRPRLWRLLHELRRPAPNKRQDHSHLTGRSLPGTLRAPPGRMAEVTATTVPGERVVADREGSWGRHLPAVDDLLSLPAGQPVRIFSSYGVTTLTAPSTLANWRNRLKLLVDYDRLARTRVRALSSDEPSVQSAYAIDLEERYGVELHFQPEGAEHAPTGLHGLALPALPALSDLLRQAAVYTSAPAATAQPALALFAGGALALMLADGWRRRDQIRAARARIPLSIGGWGTRGKSGTERIKAGLFHGLGHTVLVKTTGCEAMFIPAFPGTAAREIFLYRPYDKSTIWEQAGVLKLAAGMGARVFLWECMALRPRFVELLERDWVRDDLCTLTNAFPDHEDIQGPTGADVARTITSFVPDDAVALTSEVEFLPLFRDVAEQRRSSLSAVTPLDAELLATDLLALFPYQEHPRNVALVAAMAERLGIDRELAIVTMADNVVPDLGVLRVYPCARVEGRDLRFINGMSANERTGCVANWRRTGCDRIALDPEQAVLIVVNNRGDRVARSEVFARIMAEDLSVDSAVFIGTNTTGLLGYLRQALAAHLKRAALILPDDQGDRGRAVDRLATWMARLRVPRPDLDAFTARASVWAAGSSLSFSPSEALRSSLTRWLGPGEAVDPEAVALELHGDTSLWSDLRAALIPGVTRSDSPPEVLGPPGAEAVIEALRALLVKLVVHARLAALAARAPSAEALEGPFRAAWTALFLRAVHVIEDTGASGDRIIVTAARAAPPGTQVTVMGVQNIKGTGLDFAYRWVALGAVHGLLERSASPDPFERERALRELIAFDDHGLLDAATAAALLSRPAPEASATELALREQARRQAAEIAEARRQALGATRQRGVGARVLDRLEGLLDWLDSALRTRTAEQLQQEIVDHHVSLARAASEMQALTSRQKGGWLAEWVSARFGER